MAKVAILLAGKTGAGKSTLGNITGADPHLFKVGSVLSSETKEFTMKSCYLNGNHAFPILIVDSPGISDNRMNTGLSDSKIYQKLLNFLHKNKIHIACVLYCIEQTSTIPMTFFNELSRFIQIIGEEHTPNVYVTVTQLDTLNDQNQLKKIEMFKNDLPKMLKRIPGFRIKNVLMPHEKRLPEFFGTLIKRLECSEVKEFKIDEFDPYKPAEFLERINPLLQCYYEEAVKQINISENMKNTENLKHYQEMKLLYEIIQGQKGSDLSAVLSCIKGSPSSFLSDLHDYLTSTSNLSSNFKGNIQKVLEESSKKHVEGFLKKKTFMKTLLEDLDKNLLFEINKSFREILEENVKLSHTKLSKTKPLSLSFNPEDVDFARFDSTFLKNFQTGCAGAATLGGTFTALNAARTALQVFFTSSGTVAATTAGVEAGAIATASVTSAFLTPLAIGGAVLVFLGVTGYLISSIAWTRDGVIQTLTDEAHKVFLNPKNQDCYKRIETHLKYICILYMLNCMEILFL